MPSIFSKNAIISGDIDYYCLVCEDKIRNEENVITHLEKLVHKRNLEQSHYVKNFENEGIRKVNKGYYCQYCNVLLTTTLNISLHVKQKKHEYNKSDDIDETIISTKHAQWHDNCVIVFDNLLVTENAWNGLIDNSCVVCNVEFEDEELHKTDRDHVLNLIQKQLLVGDKKSIYRKIDGQSFHCITCNEVLPLPIENHLEEDYHDERYIQCRRNRKDLQNNTQKALSSKEERADKVINGDDSKSSKTEASTVKDVKSPKTEASTVKDGKSSKTEASKIKEVKSSKTIDSESFVINRDFRSLDFDPLEELAKKLKMKDYIFYDEKGEPMCLLCEWSLSKPNNSIRMHVSGRHHQELLKLHKRRIEKNRKDKINRDVEKAAKNDFMQAKPKNNNSAIAMRDITENLKHDDKTKNGTNNDEKSENKSDILNAITDLHTQGIEVDFICERALCKTCNNSVPFYLEAINEHIAQHKNVKSTDADSPKNDDKGLDWTKMFARTLSQTQDEHKQKISKKTKPDKSINKSGDYDMVKFAQENHINYNSSNQAYCLICQSHIAKTLTAIEEHIRGAKHTRNSHDTITPYKTVSFGDFIKTLILKANFEGIHQDAVIVNEEFCIHPISFNMVILGAERDSMCHACEKSFDLLELNNHVNCVSHGNKIDSTSFIVSEEKEFLRIIPKDGTTFHCGFCNLILTDWVDVCTHLKTASHKNKKLQSEWTLQEHWTDIEAQSVPKGRKVKRHFDL